MDLSKAVALAAMILVVLLVAGYTSAEEDRAPGPLAVQATPR